jgi:hypothetical protein
MSSVRSKFEFASTGWMAALHREMAAMLKAAAPDLRFSFCEVFTGVPKHLDRNGTGVLTWSCRIEGSRTHFVEEELDGVDVKTVGDYHYLLPLARWHLNGDTRVGFNAYLDEGTRLGKIARSGDLSKFPAVLSGLHNAAVDFTE